MMSDIPPTNHPCWLVVNEHTTNGCYAPVDTDAHSEAASSSVVAQKPSQDDNRGDADFNDAEINYEHDSDDPAQYKSQADMMNPSSRPTGSPEHTATSDDTSSGQSTDDYPYDHDLGDPPGNYIIDSRSKEPPHRPQEIGEGDDAPNEEDPDPRAPRCGSGLTPEVLQSLDLKLLKNTRKKI